MELHFLVLPVLAACLQLATGVPEQTCDPSVVLNGCAQNEYCNFDTRQCQCSRGYAQKGTLCILESPGNGHGNDTPSTSSLTGEGTNGHVVAAVLVPIFAISTLVIAVYFGQKFKVFSWLRNWLGQKTKYDEFMIGQEADDDDDPPLH